MMTRFKKGMLGRVVTVALAAAALLSLASCQPDDWGKVYVPENAGGKEDGGETGGTDEGRTAETVVSFDYDLEEAGRSADCLVVNVRLAQGPSGVYDLRLTPWSDGWEAVPTTVRLRLAEGGPAEGVTVDMKGFPAESGTLICGMGSADGGQVVVRTLPFKWTPVVQAGDEPVEPVGLESLSFPFTCMEMDTYEEKTVSLVAEPEGVSVEGLLWSVVPEGIVEIQSEGLSATLRGLAGGEARLSASCAGKSAEMTITVRESEIPFSAVLSAAEVYEGDAVSLEVTALRGYDVQLYSYAVVVDGKELPVAGERVYLGSLPCGGHGIDFIVRKGDGIVFVQSFSLNIYQRPVLEDFVVDHERLYNWSRSDALFFRQGMSWTVVFHLKGQMDGWEADWSECSGLLSVSGNPDGGNRFVVEPKALGRSRMRIRYHKGAASGEIPGVPVVCFGVQRTKECYTINGLDAGSVRLGYDFSGCDAGLTFDLKAVRPSYEICFSNTERPVYKGTEQHPGKVQAGKGGQSVITWSAGGDADMLLGAVGGLLGMRNARYLRVDLYTEISCSDPFVVPIGTGGEFDGINGSMRSFFTVNGYDSLLERFAPWYVDNYSNRN